MPEQCFFAVAESLERERESYPYKHTVMKSSNLHSLPKAR